MTTAPSSGTELKKKHTQKGLIVCYCLLLTAFNIGTVFMCIHDELMPDYSTTQIHQ